MENINLENGNWLQSEQIVLGILAHVDAGKTTLSENILYRSGIIRNIGRVDHGNSFMDTDEMEKKRGITIYSKQAHFQTGEKNYVLLDTPGHVDFSAEMERCLSVLDIAVLVISALDGMQSHTLTLWKLLQKYHVPTMIFVNKMDQTGVDKDLIFSQIKEKLSSECIDFSNEGQKNKEALWEMAAMADEDVLNDFLETGMVTDKQLQMLILNRKIFPVYFGSALKDYGVDELLEGLSKIPYKLYPAQFGAKIFKITRDEQGNRLAHIKVTGGQIKVKELVKGQNWEKEDKINQIRVYQGDKYELCDVAKAGMICSLTGLSHAQAADGLGFEDCGSRPLLLPVLNYKISWPKEMDAQSVFQKLKSIEEENPELSITWDEELLEIHALLMGEVQIEVLKNIFKERFSFDIDFSDGDVVYQETIEDEVEGVGHFEPLRHYAEVHLLLRPAAPGTGLSFKSEVSQDELSLNWQRLILTHLSEKKHRGVLTGAPITDMEIVVAAGKAHTKHTEGGDFRQATYRALRQGLMQAKSVLLEPYYSFRIEIPSEYTGRVMMDMEKMGGTCNLPVTNDWQTLLTGKAPVITVRNYAKSLLAFTKGHGHISFEFNGYEKCHNEEEIISQKGYHAENDLRNTPDSVFCAHGSGFTVPWDEVKNYMHVESVLQRKNAAEYDEREIARIRREALSKGKSENKKFGQDDEDLMKIFEKTYGPVTRKNQNTTSAKRYSYGEGASGENEKDENTQKNNDAENDKKAAQDKNTVSDNIPENDKRNKKKVSNNKNKDRYILVDGYNIIFAWDELKALANTNIEAARGKLADLMCEYQSLCHRTLILVFDAYKVKGNVGETLKYHNIDIIFTKEAETADQYIEKCAHVIGRKEDVIVATSDGLEQIIVRGQGCRLISARELKEDMDTRKKELKEKYNL